MAQLFSGECVGKATNVEIGKDSKNTYRVRFDMVVMDGEHKGKRASYSGKLEPGQHQSHFKPRHAASRMGPVEVGSHVRRRR